MPSTRDFSTLKGEKLVPFDSLLREGDALIIVPPMGELFNPCLSAHLLQGIAAEAGIHVSVLYANIMWAATISDENYTAINRIPYSELMGERLFHSAAYNAQPPTPWYAISSHDYPKEITSLGMDTELNIEPSELQLIEAKASEWAENIAAAVLRRGFKVVGCTTMFQQTSAAVAILRCIKRMNPEVVTIIGGANCEGEMAEGIASLGSEIDYIFSSESEVTFLDFLKQVLSGTPPSNRIIHGKPCMNLDELPLPSYNEFFEQLERYLPTRLSEKNIFLPYETSRGCWWGQKHHCTFCGLNGLGMAFREKSPDRVIEDLRKLENDYPVRRVQMTDNIMPYRYFQTLIPRLPKEVPNLLIFYEQKANLSLEKLLALEKAGIQLIQPGIEALSSSLLRRMKKGVSASQNIALLRYARSANVCISWNLLDSFPGDQLYEYEQTLALLPLLHHLQPPTMLCHLSIDRFSPYFDHPEDYGISNMRPLMTYDLAFPPYADIAKLAYHFITEYQSESREHTEVISELEQEIHTWKEAWPTGGEVVLIASQESGQRKPPVLAVHSLSSTAFMLIDQRGLPGAQEVEFLNREEASVALASRPYLSTPVIEWALERKLGVELDGLYVPLAVAKPELIMEFEAEVRETNKRLRLSTAQTLEA